MKTSPCPACEGLGHVLDGTVCIMCGGSRRKLLSYSVTHHRLNGAILEAIGDIAGQLDDWWADDRRRLESHVYGGVRAQCRIDGVLPLPEHDEVVAQLHVVLAERFGVGTTH